MLPVHSTLSEQRCELLAVPRAQSEAAKASTLLRRRATLPFWVYYLSMESCSYRDVWATWPDSRAIFLPFSGLFPNSGAKNPAQYSSEYHTFTD